MSDREIETMNTSSIDLICCALGGLLLIMLFVATLVRVKAEQAVLEGSASEEAQVGKTEGAWGFETAPPRPMIVTLNWVGRARFPPEIKAYPPRIEAGKPRPQEGVALDETNGMARPKGGGTFVGFFERKANDNGGQIQLVIPRGSRDPSHASSWRFRLIYAPLNGRKIGPALDPAASLQNAFERLREWSKDGAETVWPIGPDPGREPDASDGPGRLAQICRRTIFPELNRLPTSVPSPAEQYRLAFKMTQLIDRAIEEDNLQYPGQPIARAGLLAISGPVEAARPDSAAWLDRLYDYASLFAGTSPEATEDVSFSMTVRVYPDGVTNLIDEKGDSEVTLPPRDDNPPVLFRGSEPSKEAP